MFLWFSLDPPPRYPRNLKFLFGSVSAGDTVEDDEVDDEDDEEDDEDDEEDDDEFLILSNLASSSLSSGVNDFSSGSLLLLK